jgi:hypothetical protein
MLVVLESSTCGGTSRRAALIVWCVRLPRSFPPPDLRRSLVGGVVMTILFVVWVIVFQEKWKDWGQTGRDLLVVAQNDNSQWWLK